MNRVYTSITILGIVTALFGGVAIESPATYAQPVLAASLQRESLLPSRTKIKDFYNQGVTKAQREDYKGAITVSFNKALQINPRFVEAYCDRGVAQFLLGDSQGAIKDWNQALQIDPNHAEAYDRLGNARTDAGSMLLFQPVEHLQSFFDSWRLRLTQLFRQIIQTFLHIN